MSGRGRPRKAKCPDSEVASRSVPPMRRPAFTEEKQKETTETKNVRDQKKPNHTDEKPSAHTRKGKTTNHETAEPIEQNGVPKDRTKAKTWSRKTKTTEKSTEEAENTPPNTPKEAEKNSKTTKCAGRSKSAESPESTTARNATRRKEIKQEPLLRYPDSPEETMERKTVKDTYEKPAQTTRTEKSPNHNQEEPVERNGVPRGSTKTKAREKSAGQGENTPQDTAMNHKAMKYADKCLEEPAEKTKAQLERLEGNMETRGGRAKAARPLSEDKVLKETLDHLRIRMDKRSNTSEVVNKIIKHIIKHLEKTASFKDVQEPLGTGSYYENVKISDPDEFDVMLRIPVDRVQIEAFGDNGAFYSVGLKRGKNTLNKFQKDAVLSASEMLTEFRDEVKKCVKEFKEWSVERKKKGCPAVTLTTEVGSIPISLDVVLCLEVKSSWPPFTKDGLKIEKWLGTKVKQEYKRKPYYLVPKYEGSGNKEKEGVLAKDVWRVSFSHVEKAILKNHGSNKTCCERGSPSCCRKDCLKLLKHLLHLLKEKNASKFDKFCSYQAKTTLLHACCSRPADSHWEASDLSRCFQLLLQNFEDCLKEGELSNFFIPSQNLFSGLSKDICNELANCIRMQRESRFPIFKEKISHSV